MERSLIFYFNVQTQRRKSHVHKRLRNLKNMHMGCTWVVMQAVEAKMLLSKIFWYNSSVIFLISVCFESVKPYCSLYFGYLNSWIIL